MWAITISCFVFTVVTYSNSQGYQFYRRIGFNQTCSSGNQSGDLPVKSVSYCASICFADASCRMFAFSSVSDPNCKLCDSNKLTPKPKSQIYKMWPGNLQYTILDTDGNEMKDPLPHDTWKVDCNYGKFNNGFIVGIWDDKHNFDDLDKVKCLKWKAKDIVKPHLARPLYIGFEDLRSCPKGHVLTAISDNNVGYSDVEQGKCSPLLTGYHLDPDKCVTIATTGKYSGPASKDITWKVQCPEEDLYAAVAIYRKKGIHTHLVCCTLTDLSN